MGWAGGEGTREASVTPYGQGDGAYPARLADLLAERDEALLADYVNHESRLTYDRLTAGLAAQSRRGLVHPVFVGSAVTGAGVGPLTAGITSLLPAADKKAEAEGAGSASVFKGERRPAGGKNAYTPMFAGKPRPPGR